MGQCGQALRAIQPPELKLRKRKDLNRVVIRRPFAVGSGVFRLAAENHARSLSHCRRDGTAGFADYHRHWRNGEHVRAAGAPDQAI